MHRRLSRAVASALLLALVPVASAGCSGGGSGPRAAVATGPAGGASPGTAAASLAALEARHHARIGVLVRDTGTGRTVSYHADRRFAHCSTIKALAAGVLLGREPDARLDRVVRYRPGDLVDNSPVTSAHVRTGMALRDVIAAALVQSDNTALNLMLRQLGGTAGLQAALRGIGDRTTQVDRAEPDLNDVVPGDTRDTSTARALGTDLRGFLLGGLLRRDRRDLLRGWMLGNVTGGPYIRAGLPAGWKVADKTGSGGHGARNDVGVAWPPHGAPVVIGVLTDRVDDDAHSDDALIAEVTRTGLAALGR